VDLGAELGIRVAGTELSVLTPTMIMMGVGAIAAAMESSPVQCTLFLHVMVSDCAPFLSALATHGLQRKQKNRVEPVESGSLH